MSKRRSSRVFLGACPACGSEIPFRKLPRRGHHITCFECSSLLEVVHLAPLTLEWAFEEAFEDDEWYNADARYRQNRDYDSDFEFDYANLPEEWKKDQEDFLDDRED